MKLKRQCKCERARARWIQQQSDDEACARAIVRPAASLSRVHAMSADVPSGCCLIHALSILALCMQRPVCG